MLSVGYDGVLNFNSGFGSASPAYGVRMWLRYNAQTNVILASCGVSSVTDLGGGYNQVNLAFTMPDSNYTVTGSYKYENNSSLSNSDGNFAPYEITTTNFRFICMNGAAQALDAAVLSIIAVR